MKTRTKLQLLHIGTSVIAGAVSLFEKKTARELAQEVITRSKVDVSLSGETMEIGWMAYQPSRRLIHLNKSDAELTLYASVFKATKKMLVDAMTAHELGHAVTMHTEEGQKLWDDAQYGNTSATRELEKMAWHAGRQFTNYPKFYEAFNVASYGEHQLRAIAEKFTGY